jgi:hypothetical protein
MSVGWRWIGDSCRREAYSPHAIYTISGRVILAVPDANDLRLSMTPELARSIGTDLLKHANELMPPAPIEIDLRDEDPGTCTKCGQRFQLVRPGKSQPTCSCWERANAMPEGPQG